MDVSRVLPAAFLLCLYYLSCLVSGLEVGQVADEGETTVEWPKRNPEIASLHIRSNIRFRFVTVDVSSHVINSADTSEEAVFELRLPKTAYMSNLSMESDGRVQYGAIKDRQQAKSNYARYKFKHQRSHRDGGGSRTGGLENGGDNNQKLRDFNVFRVAVNIGPKKDIWFNLTYQEMLDRRLGTYRHVIDLSPNQVVRDLKLDIHVTESRPIKTVKVPPLLTSASTTPDGNAENDLAHVQQKTDKTAHVSYHPSVRQQLQMSPQGISGQFIMEYDVTRDQSAGEIYASPDHFVHFFSPDELLPLAKNVLFVLDVSMSMSGVKMDQTKVAMRTVLGELLPADAFNIITFSTTLRFWHREGLMPATADNVANATDFIQQMTASSGTNANDALLRGIDILKNAQEAAGTQSAARASMIIFLMDGEPTSGIVSYDRILTNVRQANSGICSLFCLGMDKGADFSFLQKLAAENGGRAHLIHEDADTAQQLQEFYKTVQRPLLSGVTLSYPGDTVEEGSTSQTTFANYFHGSEIVVAGRFSDDVRSMDAEVQATSASGTYERRMRTSVTQSGAVHAQMMERLWAYLTIRRLLETAAVSTNNSIASTAKTRTLDLSLRFSFVTPLTAMVIVKADQPHTNVGRLKDVSEKRSNSRKGGGLRPMHGAAQRRRHYNGGRKPFVDNDPHFNVHVQGLEEGVCFDIDGRPGDTFQLIYDGVHGIVVNGYVVSKDMDVAYKAASEQTKPGSHRRTYFGEISVLYRGGSIVVTPNVIRVNRKTLRWRTSQYFSTGGATVDIVAKKNVTVRLGKGVSFVILRHKVHKPHPTKVDFLGFYVEDGERLSRKTHGLIGQFQHQSVKFGQKPHSTKGGQMKASLLLRGPHITPHEVPVTLTRRRNMELRTHVPCWHVGNNGSGLIAGSHTDYVVPSIYYKYFSMSNSLISQDLQPLL